MAIELNGARVLLTGASGGIGNAIARALHGRGASLVITGRRTDALQKLQEELGADRVETLQCDLADREDTNALPQRAGHVDVLVANAALPASGKLGSFSPEELDRALEVNFRAPLHLAHALLPAMLERKNGHLAFVSSLSGKIAAGGASVYSATKFGIRGFSMALHDELHGTGVGVTTVFPGFISDAGMFADAKVDLPPGVGTKKPEQVADGLIDGIEKNRAEVDVAPVMLRATGWISGAAPAAVAAMNRRLGGSKVADGLAEGQRDKR
jgi:short-subunit dehydrogenase